MVTFRMGDESVKMSGRFGTFYSLDDLLEALDEERHQYYLEHYAEK